MFKQVNTFIKENIKKNDVVLIAVSGGPDSMCLLDLMLKYREKTNIKIIVSHVHHNVRKESDDELLFVKDYCAANNVIFESMKINEYSGSNFECEARNKRYDFFDKLALKYGAKYLLTAHHGDDLMETILMRIVRGSNLKGYSGFEDKVVLKNYTILRPLISVTKKDILEYNEKNSIPYVTDYTNKLDVHTRNRYRNHVIPLLKEEDSNVNLKFLKYSKLINEYDKFIDSYISKEIKKVYKDNKLNISLFMKYEYIIQIRIIQKILNIIYGDDIVYLNDRHVDNIYKIINGKSNSTINLPKGKIGIKSYDTFYITSKVKSDKYNIVFDKELILPNNRKLVMVSSEESNSNYVCRLSSKDIKLPIIVRTKKEGDIITVMNMEGHKKLKDIFIDAKIPMSERNAWPIVTDSDDNILWIPGVKKTKYNKQKNEKCDIIIKYI